MPAGPLLSAATLTPATLAVPNISAWPHLNVLLNDAINQSPWMGRGIAGSAGSLRIEDGLVAGL